MKIILIGNYPQDKQESMERFALMLQNGFLLEGFQTEVWRPVVLLAKWFSNTNAGLGKWLGYVDKWLLFPLILRWRLITNPLLRTENVKFHICDHSNAPYLPHLPKSSTSITCHDVLAIRGALGFKDAYCPATSTGKLLQKWILKHLSSASRLATVSRLTLEQLQELQKSKQVTGANWRVIHNAYNGNFYPMEQQKARKLLEAYALSADEPFILHVGSSLPRKNRMMLLEMVAVLGDQWQGRICFAGKSADEALLKRAAALGLEHRIVSVQKPDHDTLIALYSACEAFVFPSFSEGFGWPLIEAQACGAAVIASNIAPMPEVSGGTALHADPSSPDAFAAALLKLQQPGFREMVINQGFENAAHFQPAHMIKAYLQLFGVTIKEKRVETCF